MLSLISCEKCKGIPGVPFETVCCGILHCESCKKVCVKCPQCHLIPKFITSLVIKKILNSIPANCNYCGIETQCNLLKSHYSLCPLYPIDCKFCGINFERKDLLNHLIETHETFIIENIYSDYPHPLLGPKTNKLGKLAKLGENGKYYCGAQSDVKCQCCDGYCGSTNGCNCSGCQDLDIKTRNLPNGFFVNKEGTISRINNIGVYCGRKVMGNVPRCDGYCGPTNGPNCESCRILSTQLKFLV